MRIGITCYPSQGGSGILATELGKILAGRGHQIHFITSSMPFRLEGSKHENCHFHQVHMMEYPLFGESPYALVLAAKMAEVFRREKLDLIHVHYAIPHATSAILAQEILKPLAMPLVTTLHGTDITLVGKDPSFRDITRFSIERSTRVTAVSDYLKAETDKTFHTKQDVRKVHNFVDSQLFYKRSGDKRLRACSSGEGTIFLHLSNFREVKRSPDVIRIFEKIHREEPDTHLYLAGEGPDLGKCHDLVEKFALERCVAFLGARDDIPTLLGSVDILLFPSELESFGLVALEAMACEVPVIGSLSGGIPEVVVQGETGFLSSAGDIDAMARDGLRLVRNAGLRKQMGKQGRVLAKEVFPPEKAAFAYEKIYEEAISAAKLEC